MGDTAIAARRGKTTGQSGAVERQAVRVTRSHAGNTRDKSRNFDSEGISAKLENSGLPTTELLSLATASKDLQLYIKTLCRALDVRLPSEELDKATKAIASGGAVADGFRAAIESDLRQAAAEQSRPAGRPTKRGGQQSLRKKLELPPLPPGLEWPTDTFSEANKKYGWDIVRYLDERWLPLLQAGVATRRILASRDSSAINAVENYLRPNKRTGQRKEWPARLRFPTVREENDRELAGGLTVIAGNPRLAQVVASRVRQGIKVPGMNG